MARQDLQTFTISIVPLGLVPSQMERTKKGYLKKNICERYHAEDDTFADLYFGDWSNGNTEVRVPLDLNKIRI